jgi:serine/threonine protein kinase/tetratricopeptide (TPR) repeat protein
MGEVFLANDTLLQREVALKFLSRGHNNQTHDAALLAEARAASRLDHPNIGTIFGLEHTASGQPFLVMAYYDGQTLSQRIRKGPLTHLETFAIALQAARGLATAHRQNIVHRDIKPSNLILTHDGAVKIVDFGIAKAMRSYNSTQTMSISGTMAYLSPEQARGFAADQRSDLWALGVVIAEMLTAKPVFERDSDPATLYAIVHSPVPVLPADVPAALQTVVYRSLAKNPASRYQSAAEIVHDLSAITAPVSGRQLSHYRKLASGAAETGSRLWPFAAVILVIAAIAFIAVFSPLREYLSPHPASPHVVALPISATGADQALGDGLMETLTSRLSNYQTQNPDLWIVPISEVRHRKVMDPTSAHKLLNANLVIACTLTHQGDNIHLLLNLIDTKDLRQIGSGEFTGASSNLSGLEDEAVQRIATLLHLKGTPTLDAGNSGPSTSYQSYLQALGYLQRYDQPGNVDKAINLLQQTTDSDPNFALGFSWLGEAYRVKSALTKDPKFLAQAEAAVNKAVTLNPSLASIHMIMGRVQKDLGSFDLALSEYQRAVQAEPRNADAILGLADVYAAEGRYTDAEVMYRRSAALRPDYWQGFNALGLFLKHQHRYDEAAEEFKKVIQLTPDNSAGYYNLAANYIDAGRLTEAEAPLERAAQLAPSYAFFANLGILYTGQHKYQQAAAATEQALKLNARDWRVWESLGVIYQWLNERAKAKAAFLQTTSLLEAEFSRRAPQPDTLAEYSEMLAYSGNAAKARQQYEVALAMAPDDPAVLLSGASVYGTLGDAGRAVTLANKAVAAGLSSAQLDDNPSVRWLLTNQAFHAPTH